MKLREIKIRNFRGIKEASISTSHVTAFVGENNAGKSSFLRALNAFFNLKEEEKHFSSGSHLYSKRAIPKIELTFESDDPPSELKSIFTDKILRIQMEWRKDNAIYKYHKNREWRDISKETLATFHKHIGFSLIPLVRDHSKIQGHQSALLQRIVSHILWEQTKNRDEITPKFRDGFEHLQNTIFPKISKDLKKNYLINPTFSFEISLPPNITYNHVIHGLTLSIRDGDRKFPPEDCGSGVQSLTLIALYRLLGEIEDKKIIIGIEEPEMNLHPQAQRDLMISLKKSLVSEGDLQVLVTTHSASIIDQLDHLDVVVCKRAVDERRGFKVFASQLPKEYWDKHELNELKANSYFKYKNSEFFFARHIIICEGKGDSEVIRAIAEKDGINLNALGVEILNVDGIGSIRYPISILNELKFPHTVIVDKDFFFQYKNDDLDSSRDSRGYPTYKNSFSSENQKIIDLVFKNKATREALKNKLNKNHTQSLDTLERYGWVCFNHCLEIDLTKSTAAREIYYGKLSIPKDRQTIPELLINYKKAIKKPEILLHVMTKLPATNYPHSFSRIRKIIKNLSQSIHDYEKKISGAESDILEALNNIPVGENEP